MFQLKHERLTAALGYRDTNSFIIEGIKRTSFVMFNKNLRDHSAVGPKHEFLFFLNGFRNSQNLSKPLQTSHT
jgi:hypothetical protein